MLKRTFQRDPATGKLVETTDERTKALCDEISAGTEKFKQPLEFGLPRQRERRNVSGAWPLTSDAMGVSVEEIPAAQAELKKHGVYTEYDGLGRPILRDRAHRKAHMEALGFYDRDAGDGDATPKNFRESDVDEYRIQALAQAIMGLEGL